MTKNWIKGAIKNPGSFSKKAKNAGKTTAGYARAVVSGKVKATPQTKKQANLAITLSKMRKKKK